MKKLLAILLCATFILNVNVYAIDYEQQVIQASLEDLREEIATQVGYYMRATLDSAEIRIINDFAGGKFLLIEFPSAGYMIYDPDSMAPVEYSKDCASPYKGIEGELYYGGPTFYYVKDSGDDRYNSVLDSSTLEVNAALANHSRKIKNAMVDTAARLEAAKNSAIIMSGHNEAVYETDTYITNYNWIRNLHTAERCGYYCPPDSTGICGYVAAGMVFLYYHRMGKSNLIPEDMLDEDSAYTCFNGPDFTIALREIGRQLGLSDGTVAGSIASVMSEHARRRGYTLTWSITVLPGAIGIRGMINNNKPVIVFGDLYNPSKGIAECHAIVAYGYTSSGTLITHFGTNNMYAVYLTNPSLIGESMTVSIS